MIKQYLYGTTILVGYFLGVGTSTADDLKQNDDRNHQEILQPTGDWSWSITPRVWYTNLSDKRFGVTDVEASQSFPMVMSGATIFAQPARWNTSFYLTGLYGVANGAHYDDADIASGNIFQGKIHASRLDIEGVARTPLGGDLGPASVIAGVRYINGFSNITGLDSTGSPFQFKEKNNYYLLELGLYAFTASLFGDNRHSIYGQFTVGPGYKQTVNHNFCCSGTFNVYSYSRSGGVISYDSFFGYRFNLDTNSDSMSVSTRIRFQIISQGGFDFTQPTFIFGPEVNFTMRF